MSGSAANGARARGRNNRALPFYCACSGPGRRLKAAAQPLSRAHLAYLGCTFGSPPGVPGGGITLRCPPLGGVTSISRSTPAGGHMTPFDWASLSLNGSELPPPTVGGSPLTSGGQIFPLSVGGVAVYCASDTIAVTTVITTAMIGTMELNGNPSRFAIAFVNVKSSLSV